jgi:hypothetical protein
VEHRGGGGPDPVPDPVVVPDLLTGHELPVGDVCQRLAGGDLPGHADSGDQDLRVGLVGEVGGIDQRPGGGVGGGEGDAAPAAHVDGADQGPDRPLGGRSGSGSGGGPGMAPNCRSGAGRSPGLRVKPPAPAPKDAKGPHRSRRHRSRFSGVASPKGSGCAGRPPARQNHEVILEAGPHGGGVDDHREVVGAQVVGRPDA